MGHVGNLQLQSSPQRCCVFNKFPLNPPILIIVSWFFLLLLFLNILILGFFRLFWTYLRFVVVSYRWLWYIVFWLYWLPGFISVLVLLYNIWLHSYVLIVSFEALIFLSHFSQVPYLSRGFYNFYTIVSLYSSLSDLRTAGMYGQRA
jgi:hypothetical protein